MSDGIISGVIVAPFPRMWYNDFPNKFISERKMLELRNLTFDAETARGRHEIIKDVSLKIDEPFVALTGPNGGGKSTLAKLVMGMYTPTSGSILLDGEDITGLGISERAKKGVCYAFQQPVRFKGLTVSDLVSLAHGKKLTVAETCSYLSEVGLCAKEYVDRELNSSLSGGELKRIEIAMALARGAKLTLFDEPEAGIDLWSFNSLISVFEKMHERIRGTMLIISHQERILNIADRIIVLADGRVKNDGAGKDILPGLLARSLCPALDKK